MGFLSRHRKRILIALAALYGFYLVALGLVAPAIIKHVVPQELSALLNRDVSVEKFRINPFTLSVTVEDFLIESHGETPLFHFDRFHANFELSSLWRRSLHFKLIELIGPQTAIEQLSKGKFDIDDILALAEGDEDEPLEEEELQIPAFSVEHLSIEDAGFKITDHSREGSPQLHITPVSFDIEHLSTQPTEEGGNHYEFHAAGPSGGTLTWTGQLTFAPLALEGTLSLEQLTLSPFAEFFNEFVAAELASGELNLNHQYRFSFDDEVRLTLTDGHLALNNIVLLDGQGEEAENTLLTLKSLTLEAFSLDTIESKIYADSLILEEPQVLADLMEDGKINWLEAVSPIEHTVPEAESVEQATNEEVESHAASPEANQEDTDNTQEKASESPEPEQDMAEEEAPENNDEATDNTESAPDWQLITKNLYVKEGSLLLNDNTHADAGTLIFKPINLAVHNIHWPSRDALKAELALGFDSGGELTLTTEGTLEPIAFTGELRLNDFTLPPLNPWLAEQMPLFIESGTAFLIQEFELALDDEDALSLVATGEAHIDDFSLREMDKRTIASWASVVVDNTQLNLQEQQLRVGNILLDGVNSSLNLAADGSSWLDIFADEAGDDVAADTTSHEEDAPWRVIIDDIELRNNKLSYYDASLSPAFRIGLDGLSGRLTNIDTAGEQESAFNFTARVDGNAPLTLKGKGFLLNDPISLELDTVLEDYEMTRLSPFTGSFLGYLTQSGQLSVESQLKIHENLLDTNNKILAKRFYLGDKVESEDAISAPIKLGLSVLRDRRENINLPVKAKGDLADPSVSVSNIILSTFSNILVRAATSPFSVLMGLGGGSEQEYLPFAPGSVSLDEEGKKMVATLAQALKDRPRLRVTLTGAAALPDQEAMATQLVGDDILGRRWEGLSAALENETFHKRVMKAWERVEHEDTLSGSPVEQAEAAFKQLVHDKMQHLDENALLTLANYRADQLKAILVDEYELEGSRITVANSVISSDDEAGVKLDISRR